MNPRERGASAKEAKEFVPSERTPAALREAALKELQAGQFANAESCCQQALALESQNSETLHLMARVHLGAGQFDHAAEWALRAIRNEPRPAYLTTLGTALLKKGWASEALQAFNKAVQLKPDDPEVWMKFGEALQEMKRTEDALRAYLRASEVDPRNLEAAYRSGIILRETGRLGEALAVFDKCLEIRPDDVRSLHFRACTLRDLGRMEESVTDNMRAHQLDPRNLVHCNNVADALLWLDRHEEAGKWFDKALALQPDNVDVLDNKARWYREGHQLAKAADLFERLRRTHPLKASRFERELGFIHLTMGNLEAGWRGREARWKVPGLSIVYPNFTSQPMWRGDTDLTGKTILIYSDEGLGDAIQFARYVPMVAARGASVILSVQDALLPLMSGMAGVRECRSRLSLVTPPAMGLFCPMASLPFAFGTNLETIPPAQYLPPVSADRAQAWEERLGPHDRLRVGLVWSGNAKHVSDQKRSVSLRTMTKLLDIDATFVSLQKDLRPADKLVLSERRDIVDLTAHLTDFAETAALISRLDVVITVDTSVAHLAATLGRPTWILLPYLPDWRWLLDRDDSPWYPTVRLFRQTEAREYGSVLDRVRTELMALAKVAHPSAGHVEGQK